MSSFKNMDWPEVLLKVKTYATSELARQQIQELQPLASAEAAEKSFSQIGETSALIQQGLRPSMESLDLYGLWAPRLQKRATLKTLEIRDIRAFCIDVLTASEVLTDLRTPWLSDLRGRLLKAEEPLSAIDQIISPAGEIRTDASETLYGLTREKADQIRSVKNVLDKLVKANEMETILQDRYVTTREGRWVLPVRSGMQHSFQGIIHGASQTKQTVYMEPQEIVPINNRLRQIEEEIEAEIERLLTELSLYLASLIHQFEITKDLMLSLDVHLSKGQFAARVEASACTFSDEEVTLPLLRHPLLVANGTPVVANHVSLNRKERILLLSGPNAGGKTILLKAVGLAAHMARCGLPICSTSGAKLPFFTNIYLSVGDSQSVDEHLSTFAAHLKILDSATKANGPQELLLIDEICGSTDPEEGVALARSFINSYARAGVFAVVTSHLGGLKLGWTPDSGVINGSMEFSADRGPTYKFLWGIPGQSLALKTAQRVGVSASILDEAKRFLSPEVRAYQSGVEEIEQLRQDLDRVRTRMEEESQNARKAQEEYQRLTFELERQKEKILDSVLKGAEKKVQEAMEKASAEQVFRKHEEFLKIRTELPEIIKAPTSTAPISYHPKTAEDFAKAFPPGSKVFVTSLHRDGVVQSKPTAKGEVTVVADSIRLTVDWKLLKPPEKGGRPQQEVLRRTGFFGTSPVDEDRTVDLRGKTVEEAIAQLEVELDKAAVSQEDRIKVIHGHGTDSLKKSVRNYLSRSTYVKKWQAGSPESGGDGITWIELAD